MASIQTGIELYDGFTGVMFHIISSIDYAVSAMENMQGTMASGLDTGYVEEARVQIDQAAEAVNRLDQAVSGLSAQTVNVPEVEMPEAPQVISVDVVPEIPDPFIPEAQEIRPDIVPNAPPQAMEEMELPVRPVMTEPVGMDSADRMQVEVAPVITGMPALDLPENVTVPVHVEVEGIPELNIPESVTVPVRAEIENLPELDLPESIMVPVKAEVTEQPVLELSDEVTVPVRTELAQEALTGLPEEVTVPVYAETEGVPDLNIPESVTVPVYAVAESAPELGIPESITVPIRAEIAQQPEIDLPENVTVPVLTEVTQPEIELPESVTVPVRTEVAPPVIDLPEEMTVPVHAEVEDIPELNIPESITVPVHAEVENVSELNLPESVSVPVHAEVESAPDLNLPESVTVPVEAEVTRQPVLEVPEKVQVDVEVAGGGEYRQQVAEITGRLEETARLQQAINDVAKHMYILPEETAGEIGGINRQITQMEQALNFLEQNPFHLDASVTELQIKSISAGLDELAEKQQKLDGYLGNIPSQTVHLDVDAQELAAGIPEVVRVPVEWQTDGLEVFSGSGLERFRQEVQSADAMLQQLCGTQDAIARQAYNTNFLPPEAFRNLNSLAVRMDSIRDRIRQIEGNPLNMGTDLANRQLEQLRGQLNQLVNGQNELNAAMADMDVGAANAAYLRLSQTVSGTERYIRDNVDEQGRFNQEIAEGVQQADTLMDTIKKAAAAYISIQSVGKVLGISDELVQTTSRLNMMNDGAQTTQELVNMVYAAAQDARGSFSEMADVVARFGNNAKDAFGSSAEVVAFADLIQKQMTIAGASTQEASNAMLQLSQALGSGVLRGDELNSIFEQAPNLIQNIADYLGVPIGQIREMASEGELSADVVKAAVFDAAGEINARFKDMPMTWGQAWQSMQNTALIAFQPVLQRVNDIASSESFQAFVNGAVQAMAILAGVVLDIFDLVAAAGSFIEENWSVISPVVYGVIAALTAYLAISALVAVANGIHAAATAMATGVTFAYTAAQYGLNAALAACPLTWIIILVIALIAALVALCNWIAEVTGAAESGFGIIAGCVNVGIEWFKNLGLEVANIALGITMAILAVTSNMKTAFHNAVASVQAWFYDLMYTVLATIDVICAKLNEIPFVEFDYSGVTDAARDYAVKAQEARDSKEDYVSVADAFRTGSSTFDTFQDGWAADAFDAGAAWGDGVAEKVSNFSLADLFDKTDLPDVEDYTSGFDDIIATNGMAGALGDIADDTGSIKDSLDCTEEDLKYLRDIAEQETVNRFTVAEVKVEQTNYNNIGSSMDLDGVMSGLTESVKEAADSMAEGVHE